MNAPPALRGVRAAVVLLTRVPIGGFPYDEDAWRWAAAHLPLVGALLGGALACVDCALSPLGSFAAALGAIAASLLLTGAFHEDGLADTCDALGGGFDRAKVLLILKDSRVGAFGACALVVSLVGRAALLARLGAEAPPALVLVGALARVGPVWQIALLPYVTTASPRSGGVTRAGRREAWVASGWGIVVAAAVTISGHASLGRVAGVFAVLSVVTISTGWRYVRRLGGITGDFLGATEQLCELAALAALAWGIA